MKKAKENYQEKLEDFLGSWKERLSSGKLYFIENKQGKKVPFIPNESQQFLYDNLHYYNVIPKARQRGFSTAIEILGLDHCLFNDNVAMGVIAHNLEDAKKIFKTKVKFPYDNLGGFDPETPEYAVGQEIKRNVYPTKDNESTLEFSNGSSIYVSTSFRSGTLQFLHVSEFGKIASKYPEKAKEILSGAFEAVGEGGMIFLESTAEGKNDFFVIVKHAEKLHFLQKPLNHLEPKLFFFSWWEAEEYTLKDESIVLTQDTINYFKRLKKDHNIEVSRDQARWWQVKSERLKELMGREYPSYLDEAFEIIVMGAYYKTELEQLQKDGRYRFAPYDSRYPVYLVGDIGILDAMDMSFFQVIGSEIRVIKWWRGSNMSFIDFHNGVISKEPYAIKKLFVPHDAVKRNQDNGGSVKDTAKQLGYSVKVLKRTGILSGINHLRSIFNRIVINNQDTTQPIDIGGEKTMLTMIDVLSAYKEAYDKAHGLPLGRPEHNDASHTGDNVRYLGQAVSEIEKDRNSAIQDTWSPDYDDLI